MDHRTEIADLIARLAHVGDHGDLEDYGALYAADATWEYTSGPVRGADAIIANARAGRESGRVGPGSGLRHVVTTVSVTNSSDAAADADSYVLVYDTSTTPPELRSMVRYHDTWRRDTGRWQLAARHIIKA